MSALPFSPLPGSPLEAERLTLLRRLVDGLDPTSLAWISGYAAGLAAERGQSTAGGVAHVNRLDIGRDASTRATILYGSQTGNGRRIAERMGRTAEASGLAVRVVSAADFAPKDLANEKLVFWVLSTHGDGDPPDDMRALIDYLMSKRAPKMERMSYSVLALGDSSYPQYCATGRQIDARLSVLGAKRLQPTVECDVDYESRANGWVEHVMDVVRKEHSAAPRLAIVPTGTRMSAAASREHPAEVEVLCNQKITGRDSPRDIWHIELTAPAEALAYHPGDSIAVVHENPAEMVQEVLSILRLDGAQTVKFDGREFSLQHWLTREREIARLTRPFLEALAKRSGAVELLAALTPEKSGDLRAMLKNWQTADALLRFPADWDGVSLVQALRGLTARQYSIASSRSAVGDEVHLTVAAVDYQINGLRRFGAASRYLGTQSADSGKMRVYVDENPRFRLPQDASRDIIMVGPGTGVAPFRAFVQERAAVGASGRQWLFFGARHFHSEFLYQSEWLEALKKGQLTHLDVAFSRDQGRKVYVQNRLRERGAEIFRWLESGAYFYVCGDANAMAPDVHKALLDIVAEQGGRDRQAAESYVAALATERRYLRDVY